MNKTQMQARKATQKRAFVISALIFSAIFLAVYFGGFEALDPFDGK